MSWKVREMFFFVKEYYFKFMFEGRKNGQTTLLSRTKFQHGEKDWYRSEYNVILYIY